MSGSKRELRLVSWRDRAFQQLVAQLDRSYVERFGDVALKYQAYHHPEELEHACVLYLDGQPVACGAFQRRDARTAELKRVFVRPDCRRRGYARDIVEMLEQQALFHGYSAMSLETGREMPEAVALYRGLGYREVPGWGVFAGDPVCICMEKELLE